MHMYVYSKSLNEYLTIQWYLSYKIGNIVLIIGLGQIILYLLLNLVQKFYLYLKFYMIASYTNH